MCASSYVPNAIYKDTIVIPQRMAAAGLRRLSFHVVFFILEYVTKGGNTMGLFGQRVAFLNYFLPLFSHQNYQKVGITFWNISIFKDRL